MYGAKVTIPLPDVVLEALVVLNERSREFHSAASVGEYLERCNLRVGTDKIESILGAFSDLEFVEKSADCMRYRVCVGSKAYLNRS